MAIRTLGMGGGYSPKLTNGAAHVRTAATDVAYNTSQYTYFTSAVGAADNTVLYTSGDVTWANIHIIENITGSTNDVDVFVSLDGTNFLASPSAVQLHDATTQTTHVVTIAPGDIGILRGKYSKIKVQQNGATDATARIAHGVE